MGYKEDLEDLIEAIYNQLSQIAINGRIYKTMPYVFTEDEAIFLWPERSDIYPYSLSEERHDVEVRILVTIRSHQRSTAMDHVEEIVGDIVNTLSQDYTAGGTAIDGKLKMIVYDYEPKALLRQMSLMGKNIPIRYGMVSLIYHIAEEVWP